MAVTTVTSSEEQCKPVPRGNSPTQLVKEDIEHMEAKNPQHGDFAGDITDEVEAKRIRRKIDYRLMPLLVCLYILAYLDRVNIGNARLWNLESDLGMTGNQYNIAVMVFYVPYIVFGIPANYVLTRVPPRFWIGFLTIGWGLTVLGAGFCHNYAGLITARVFVGIFEAGMFPGCMYLINTWYCRHELSTRMAWFLVANDVAGATSGLIGAGLGSIDGVGGYSGWSWIFFIEGAVTIIGGIFAVLFVPDFPEESTWMKPEEKEFVIRRLQKDDGRSGKEMTVKGVCKALLEWKIWVPGFIYLGVCITAYSISIFTPTILSTFGWDSIKANLLSSPIRAVSAVVSVGCAIWSDKIKRRGIFVISGFVVSAVGNIVVMLMTDGNVRYAGLYIAAIGIFVSQPLVIGWSVNQVVGPDKRGTLTGIVSSMGQVGGIVSALAFPQSDGPQYVPGIAVNIAFIGVGMGCSILMWVCCNYENKQRAAGKRDHLRELPEDEQAKLGEKHPDFRYTL